MPVMLLIVLLIPQLVMAQPVADDPPKDLRTWMANFWEDALEQITSPLFWFGMGAQTLFFCRFVVQWIVSERRKKSTVPIVFWYFSLAGGLAMLTYGFLRHDLVIMFGQALACFIYTRNLMLIRAHANRRRRAGLPANGSSPDQGAAPQPERK